MEYDIKKIFNELKNEGFSIIDIFWDDTLNFEIEDYYKNRISPLFNKANIDKFGNRSFTLADKEILESPFEKIKNSPIFKNLYLKLLEYNNINIKNSVDVFDIVYLQRNEMETNYSISSKFHFDAFYLTIIIPFKLPINKNDNGHAPLIIYPNLRKIAFSSYGNYIVKFFTQNYLFRFFANSRVFKKILNSKIIDLEKNKMILFYGYRSFHGNMQLKNKNLKAQAIFHIYNPHKNSRIDNYVFMRNKKIRASKLKN